MQIYRCTQFKRLAIPEILYTSWQTCLLHICNSGVSKREEYRSIEWWEYVSEKFAEKNYKWVGTSLRRAASEKNLTLLHSSSYSSFSIFPSILYCIYFSVHRRLAQPAELWMVVDLSSSKEWWHLRCCSPWLLKYSSRVAVLLCRQHLISRSPRLNIPVIIVILNPSNY